MEELITRTNTIKEAIDQIVKWAKELADLFLEEQLFDQMVFTKDGQYIVTVLADPNGEVDIDVKIL